MSFYWARLWYSILGSPDYMALPEHMRWRWDMLVVIVRCKGKDGFLDWSDRKIAFILNISKDEWLETKRLFASNNCNFINILDGGIEIINFKTWQPSYDNSTARVTTHRKEHGKEEIKK